MAVSYKLPKLSADHVAILGTPTVATDVDLSTGLLTLKDEAGNAAIKVLISDITGWKYNAYAAGTPNDVDIDLTAAVLTANSTYSVKVSAPYVQDFYGGGKETGAIFSTRTYTVSVDATPTVAEIQALLIARINADTTAFFTATSQAGDIVRIEADSALAGALVVTTTISGATIADAVAWVEPVGTVAEVKQYVNDNLVIGAGYHRYILEFRKHISHNGVKGLQVVKPAKAIYYIDAIHANTAATVVKLTSIFDGTYATTADYLGAPAF